MNKIMILIASSLCMFTIQANQIKLDSVILAHADGLFPIGINGDVVALIKQYQNQMAILLQGKKRGVHYEGVFSFEGKKYTIQELTLLEAARGTTIELMTVRHKIIKKFEKISHPFRQLIKDYGIKPLMGDLIEESIIKRNRHNSLLYIWAKTDEKNEHEIFDKYVKSIKDLEIFMIDLSNFLGDIVYNCPRGHAQYKEYRDKFNKAAQFVRELKLNKEHHDLFLKYINKNLSTLSKDEISLQKVKELYNAFKPTAALAH